MKFKKGDIVAEYLGENIYLTVITYIYPKSNYAQGYVIDEIYRYSGLGKDHMQDMPYYTSHDEYSPVDLRDCILIERKIRCRKL